VTRLFAYDREREEDHWAKGGPEERSAIERGLAMLASPDREVLLLVCVEEMEPRQAAHVLGISHAALRQRLGRARARLKVAMTKLETVAGAPRRVHVRQT
jgi:RNA polymerase sigma-70 factor, ECF subfamily